MNATLDSSLTRLTQRLLGLRSDITFISPPDPTRGVGSGYLRFGGGPHYFDDDCIYDRVDDPTAKWLLDDFLSQTSLVGWEVCLELSKLLSKRGKLVELKVLPLIGAMEKTRVESDGTSRFAHGQLFLSYLALAADGESRALKLLDIVPENFRDGLLLACYKLNTPALYDKLKSKVRQWRAASEQWGESSGEKAQFRLLVSKWDRIFPDGKHDDIRALCAPQ